MTYYMYFIQTFIIRFIVSEILAEIDHKGQNWTFLTLKMTFRVIPYLSYFRAGIPQDWFHNKQEASRPDSSAV